MERTYYHKLIRDGVVSRMRKKGVAFEIQKLGSDADFRSCLIAKISEEASGVAYAALQGSVDQLMDEIADLERVIAEVKRVFAIDEGEMARVRAKNFSEKGGFDTRTFLVWSQSEGYTSNEA